MYQNKHKDGFVALTAVLVLSAILFSVSISIASRSIVRSDIDVAEQAHARAQVLTFSCVQHALLELQRTLDYAGGDTFTIGGDTCDIVEITGEGNTDRTIQAESMVSGYMHRMEAHVSTVSPRLIITRWEDVEAF